MFRNRKNSETNQVQTIPEKHVPNHSSSKKHVSGEDKSKCISNTVLTINDLLKFMTSLDYVKEMIGDANKQAEMLETVAANSEELSASTEEIATHVTESNEKVTSTVETTNIGLQSVDSALEKIESNFQDTERVKISINEVMEETKKINELVGVIKSVADQTNLLSLNASIEAARAGEQGRGFSVVASEIKVLAENTKEQVEIIRNIVDGVNKKVLQASKEIDRVVSNFGVSKTSIDEATVSLKSITSEMDKVAESFMIISANVQEQSATTQEIASTIQVVNDKAQKLSVESNKTGSAFFEISQKIDTLRVNALSCADQLDKLTILDLSITDHLMWKWRIYNMILGYIKLDTEKVGDHHGCRLGKWIKSQNSTDSNVEKIIRAMEAPHAKVHSSAKNAINYYNNRQFKEAEACLAEIEDSSAIVVELLTELKKYI